MILFDSIYVWVYKKIIWVCQSFQMYTKTTMVLSCSLYSYIKPSVRVCKSTFFGSPPPLVRIGCASAPVCKGRGSRKKTICDKSNLHFLLGTTVRLCWLSWFTTLTSSDQSYHIFWVKQRESQDLACVFITRFKHLLPLWIFVSSSLVFSTFRPVLSCLVSILIL